MEGRPQGPIVFAAYVCSELVPHVREPAVGEAQGRVEAGTDDERLVAEEDGFASLHLPREDANDEDAFRPDDRIAQPPG